MKTAAAALLLTASAVTGGAPPPSPQPISFSASLGSFMVLQQQPAKACVYGRLGTNGTAATIHVADTGGATPSFDVEAQVTAGGEWKACLLPTAAGGDFTITATCTGCANATAAVLEHVTFGDVWYCVS